MQTAKLLLEYHGDPYQENDQGLTPIDVCKSPEILALLREGRRPSVGGKEKVKVEREEGDGGREEEEEEEEDVFVRKAVHVRDSHLKKGSKGSSRSSGDSICEEGEEEDGGVARGGRGEADDIVSTPTRASDKKMGHTPKSRPRSALYSDLSSSEGEGDNSEPPRKLGGRKVRYQLAKVGEAKQRFLGKLEESGELEGGRGKGVGATGSAGHVKEEGNEDSDVESELNCCM